MRRETAEPDVGAVPGDRSSSWIQYQAARQAVSTAGLDAVWAVDREASGPFFTDPDGNVFMDFASHIAAAPLGYNHPDIADRLDRFDLAVDPLKVAAAGYRVGRSDPPSGTDGLPVHLMDRLLDRSATYGLGRVFLSNSGAEAMENAIKIAYDYGGHRAVTFEGAFHGRTLGALSLNRSKRVHRRDFPEIPAVISLPYCTCSGDCACGWRTDGPTGTALGDRLHPEAGSLPPDEVAFLVLEPVQGEGGYRIPNDQFIEDIEGLSAEHDLLVIADEIQSGIGRTGEFWAVDHTPLTPDVITAAKGLRVGATVSRAEVFPDTESRIASTWGGGDLLHSLVGAVTIDVIEDRNLLANAIDRGRQFRERLEAEAPEVADVRGLGLMLAVELDSKAQRDAVRDAALNRGLIVIGCGRKSLRVLPPLDVTEREIDLGVDLLKSAIAEATT